MIRAVAAASLAALALVTAAPAWAQTPLSRFARHTGNVQYTGTAATLRAQSNSGDACALNSSASATLAGIPSGATIRAAYLYWAGSGSTVDSSVQLRRPGSGTNFTVNASRTFTEVFPYNGTDYDYFSGFADVTSIVAAGGNGSYRVQSLTVSNGSPWCNVSGVVSGWAMVVVYEHASQPLRIVDVFDGFQYFRGSQIQLNSTNFKVPTTGADGRLAHISWEGDVENSSALGGFSENLLFGATSLTDGSNPLNNQFNSTSNIVPTTTSYGVDFDSHTITSLLTAGQTSATTTYSSGADLVLLSAEVLSITTSLVDLSIDKSHSGNFTVGTNGTYTIAVSNAGPNTESGPIVVTDVLPAGLTYVNGTGTGWSCGAVGQTVTCTRVGSLASGASAANITLTVAVGAAAAPSVTNTASVVASDYDEDPTDDSDSDPTTVVPSADKSITKSHSGNFVVGTNGTYTIAVSNAGPSSESGPITVTDVLPAGLTYVNGTGTGWSCGAVGQTVTCTRAGSLASGASAADITLTVSVGGAAAPSTTNTASVAGAQFDPAAGNNSSSDPTTVIAFPDMVVFKTVSAYEDPINGLTNAKAIPGATVVYTIGVTNQGPGPADADSLRIDDPIPSEVALVVTGFGGASPVQFVDGATSSGLSLVFTSLSSTTDDLEFDDGSSSFTYTPVPDVNGCDVAVRAIRVRPSGTFAADLGPGAPSFQLRFRARVP